MSFAGFVLQLTCRQIKIHGLARAQTLDGGYEKRDSIGAGEDANDPSALKLLTATPVEPPGPCRQDQGKCFTAASPTFNGGFARCWVFKEIKELADALSRPHDGMRGLTPDLLWHAYEILDRSKVRGSGGRVLTDIVSLVRYALREQPELHPYQEDVNARFTRWIVQQESAGKLFTPDQLQRLEAIRDHIATSPAIDMAILWHCGENCGYPRHKMK